MQRLISAMRAAGITPRMQAGRLVIDCPHRVDDELLREIGRHEKAIVEFVTAARERVQEPPMCGEGGAGPAPLTPAQAGVLFTDRLFAASGLFNVLTEIDIAGELNLRALLSAIVYVLRRYPLLTARVVEPMSWVESAWTLREIVRVLDLCTLPAARRDDLRGELAVHECRTPFKGPWLRIVVLQWAPRSWLLMMCRHHVASDGESFALIGQEIQEAYRGWVRGNPPLAPSNTGGYWQYCRFIRAKAEDPAGIRYWLTRLADAPLATRLPRFCRAPDRVSPAHVARFTVPRKLFRPLYPYRITSFAALLGTLALLLYRDSHQSELCIGTDVTTRDRPEWEREVGMFVNRLALRVAVDDRQTVLSFLATVQQEVSSALVWRYTSLDHVARRLGLRARGELFNVLIGLHNNAHCTFELDGLDCHVRDGAVAVSEMDLSLYFTSTPESFNGLLTYRKDCFDPQWAQDLIARFCRIAETLGSALQGSVRGLLEAGVPEPEQDSEWLLAQRWQAVYGAHAELSFPDDAHDV